LLRTTTPVSKLRGRWHEYEGTPLMPTFHPAYLLRTPGDKRLAWEDLKQVIDRLGLAR
jgi:DNA polymerase